MDAGVYRPRGMNGSKPIGRKAPWARDSKQVGLRQQDRYTLRLLRTESLAASASVCASNSALLSSFESLLFPGVLSARSIHAAHTAYIYVCSDPGFHSPPSSLFLPPIRVSSTFNFSSLLFRIYTERERERATHLCAQQIASQEILICYTFQISRSIRFSMPENLLIG